MKKQVFSMLTALSVCAVCAVSVSAEITDESTVYVTISDENGALVLAQEAVTVTDIDADGALTVDDALYAAHEAHYQGGAASGYASSEGQYGTQLDTLWGTTNGGGYGYYVNHASALNLDAPIESGDYISAYVYTDLTAWSDTYCFFDQDTQTVSAGESISLTLSAAGYDENWAPITLPVADAVITINGEATEYSTDENGAVTLSFDKSGEYIVSASSDTQTLVPPVYKVTVSALTETTTAAEPEQTTTTTTASQTAPATGENSSPAGYLLCAAGLAAAAITTMKKRNHDAQ